MKNAVFWVLAQCRSCVNLRNVGSHEIYTAPHPRRRHSSYRHKLARNKNSTVNEYTSTDVRVPLLYILKANYMNINR
jgi:hypothetical protein